MSSQLLIVLALLAAAVAMFVVNTPRMDAVALIMIVALPLTGVLTVQEALAGFSDPNIVLIGALFVIGEGLVRTGVARRLGDWLYDTAGASERRLLPLLMLAVGGLGAVMSSTAVVAIFIPVVLRICTNTGLPPGKLMMPLSVAALVSGMLTLVATAPNLVVNAELIRQGSAGFAFFSFTPFGLPILILAVLYMLAARRFLPAGPADTAPGPAAPTLRDWVTRYNLAARSYRVRIAPGSPLIGECPQSHALRDRGITLLAIQRQTRFGTDMIRPTPHSELRADDVLLLDALVAASDVPTLAQTHGVERLGPADSATWFTDQAQELGLAEAIVPADSDLVGRTVLDIRATADRDLTIIGVRRGRDVVSDDLAKTRLRTGDTILLVGFWTDIRRLRTDSTHVVLLNLPADSAEVLPVPGRAYAAVAVLALVVGLMISGVVPAVHAALLGCLLMGLAGCVDMTSAYRSISWKSLVLIVGMMPFSIALQRTGGVDLAADALLHVVGEASTRSVLAALFLVTAVLGLFISNTATAVLMAPVSLAIAHDLGASPYPFAMTVALAASAAFMTPISSPVNTLVVGPGNYAFGDFVKIGAPFTLIVMAVAVLLVPWLLPP